MRPSGSGHFETALEKTEDDDDEEEEEDDVEDLRRLFRSLPSSPTPHCTSSPLALRGGPVGGEEGGHRGAEEGELWEGEEEEGGSPGGGSSKLSVELHSEGVESREEEEGGPPTLPSDAACISAATLPIQDGVGGGAVT